MDATDRQDGADHSDGNAVEPEGPQRPPVRDLYEDDAEFEAAMDRALEDLEDEGLIQRGFPDFEGEQ